MKLTASSLLLLLYFQSAELISEVIEGCSENEFKPEDEKDSEALATLNQKLEEKTFKNTVPLSTSCPKTQCTLDPKGEAVWIARDNLYKKFSMYSEGHLPNTLDGCFCNSATREDLNSCLGQVRKEMADYLDSSFNSNLAEIIENGKCQAFQTNCINK